jgi:hypothetical protein
MPNTRGDLEPATIINLTSGDQVYCMFNPHEFTVTKQNRYSSGKVKGRNVPKIEFDQGGAQTLKLQLFFDTYGEGTDVREHTQGLWDMMMITDSKMKQRSNKSEPPDVEFRWGRFSFRAVITNISQKFTLFLKEGTPVRTTVDVTFQQKEDPEDHAGQNPTSGGGPPLKLHTVQAGERLDWIAAMAYGEASHWRLIARANNLDHPLRLHEGQQLVIPPLE